MEQLIQFLNTSYTPYHACENAETLLLKHGFTRLREADEWTLCEGGKYYVLRGGAIVAFTVGNLNALSYKIVASHTDSPALKIKENPVMKSGLYATLNTETYGGGIWYSFFDRPLRLAGRVIKKEGNTLYPQTALSPFTLTIPSVAIHQNRTANEGFSVNPQVDLLPLLSLAQNAEGEKELIERIAGEGVVSHELYLVNADMPYTFGMNGEFLASPRIDNLTSVFASLQALVLEKEHSGICVAACMNNEEIGSSTTQGADGDFLATVLKRIAYALRFDDNEYYKALANSFLLSCDNAHAVHPNHPEKSDPTNKVALGGGVVIKNHANKAYITDAMSSAIVKTVLEKAEVSYQAFFNRSDVRSGSTLGTAALRYTGMLGADIGIPQLAMHSACESFAKADYTAMEKALTAFYQATLTSTEDGLRVE
ncbi:MAG: M18 family aminopeptidase [Clostridia bacterium]|nr:M18 family aminopeptidase [Clostridia bacterium]